MVTRLSSSKIESYKHSILLYIPCLWSHMIYLCVEQAKSYSLELLTFGVALKSHLWNMITCIYSNLVNQDCLWDALTSNLDTTWWHNFTCHFWHRSLSLHGKKLTTILSIFKFMNLYHLICTFSYDLKVGFSGEPYFFVYFLKTITCYTNLCEIANL